MGRTELKRFYISRFAQLAVAIGLPRSSLVSLALAAVAADQGAHYYSIAVERRNNDVPFPRA